MQVANDPGNLGVGFLECQIEIRAHLPEEFVPAFLESLELGAVFVTGGLALGADSFGLVFLRGEGGPTRGQFAEHALELAIIALEQGIGSLEDLAGHAHARGNGGC